MSNLRNLVVESGRFVRRAKEISFHLFLANITGIRSFLNNWKLAKGMVGRWFHYEQQVSATWSVLNIPYYTPRPRIRFHMDGNLDPRPQKKKSPAQTRRTGLRGESTNGKRLMSGWAPAQSWDQIHLGDGWCSAVIRQTTALFSSLTLNYCMCSLSSKKTNSKKSITGVQSDSMTTADEEVKRCRCVRL